MKKNKILILCILLIIYTHSTTSAQIITNNNRFIGKTWIHNMDKSYNERFEEIWNGILKDKITNLKWSKDDYGNWTDFESAINICKSKWENWRIPTIYELRTLTTLKTTNEYWAVSQHKWIRSTWWYYTSTIIKNPNPQSEPDYLYESTFNYNGETYSLADYVVIVDMLTGSISTNILDPTFAHQLICIQD